MGGFRNHILPYIGNRMGICISLLLVIGCHKARLELVFVFYAQIEN